MERVSGTNTVPLTPPSDMAISKFRAEVVKQMTAPVAKYFTSKIKMSLQIARTLETLLRKYDFGPDSVVAEDMDQWMRTRGGLISKTIDLEQYFCSLEQRPLDKGVDERRREQTLTSVFDVEEGGRSGAGSYRHQLDLGSVEERLVYLSNNTPEDVLRKYPSIVLMGMDTVRFVTLPVRLLTQALVPELSRNDDDDDGEFFQ